LIKLSTPPIELNSFLCGFFSGQQRSIIFLAKVLLVSISATSFLGPTHPTPAFSSSLTMPLASGFSGPIIAKSTSFFCYMTQYQIGLKDTQQSSHCKDRKSVG